MRKESKALRVGNSNHQTLAGLAVAVLLMLCHYKGRKVKSIERRRYVEFSLLFIQ